MAGGSAATRILERLDFRRSEELGDASLSSFPFRAESEVRFLMLGVEGDRDSGRWLDMEVAEQTSIDCRREAECGESLRESFLGGDVVACSERDVKERDSSAGEGSRREEREVRRGSAMW